MTESAARDYAAEVVALGRAEPESPALYNAIRRGIDDWFGSTSEVTACKRSQPSGYASTFQPNHDDGDPWCDGLARYVVTRIGWAEDADDTAACDALVKGLRKAVKPDTIEWVDANIIRLLLRNYDEGAG